MLYGLGTIFMKVLIVCRQQCTPAAVQLIRRQQADVQCGPAQSDIELICSVGCVYAKVLGILGPAPFSSDGCMLSCTP